MRSCPQSSTGSADAPPNLSIVGTLGLTLLLLLVVCEINTLLLGTVDPLSLALPRLCEPDENMPLTKLLRRDAEWYKLAVDRKPRPGTRSLPAVEPGIDDIEALSRPARWLVLAAGAVLLDGCDGSGSSSWE